MVNINAQTWLNEKYPKEGVRKRDSDKKSKDKERKDVTNLDISKGKIGRNGEKNLVKIFKTRTIY